ncbi:unnamed protein product [Clavelina lepadiformis]|uniref:Uncharacterized protein n=1 Tax=Clavelina lepadiformis TaxID=159417 RepID=A0ABP0F4P6_CLALP
MRDIALQNQATEETSSNDAADANFQKINEPLKTNRKTVYLADAGIAFNSPYPPMLRAARGVDIILF